MILAALQAAAAQVPAEPHYTAIQIATGIFALVAAIGGLLGIINMLRGWGKDRSGELKEGQDTILKRMSENREALQREIADNHTEVCQWREDAERRLRTLEERVTRYKTREELEADAGKVLDAVKHEKVNREQADAQLTRMAEKNAEEIVLMKVAAGKLEQRLDAQAETVTELKGLLKELTKEMRDGFKSVTEHVDGLFQQLANSVREVRDVKPRADR